MNDQLKELKPKRRPRMVISGNVEAGKYRWTLLSANNHKLHRRSGFSTIGAAIGHAETVVAATHGLSLMEWRKQKPEGVRIMVAVGLEERLRQYRKDVAIYERNAPGGDVC